MDNTFSTQSQPFDGDYKFHFIKDGIRQSQELSLVPDDALFQDDVYLGMHLQEYFGSDSTMISWEAL